MVVSTYLQEVKKVGRKGSNGQRGNGKPKRLDSVASAAGNRPRREIVDVPLDKIHRHPANRQIKDTTCRDLASDLQARGLLQPIQIREPGPCWLLPEGHYQIVFGERRTIAARLAGWDTIPAEIVTLSDQQTQEAIAAENGHRQQLDDVERARRLAVMIKPVSDGGGGLTQTQAAAAMGIDQSTASTLVKLLRLPQAWQDLVIAGAMPGSHLRPLLPYAECPLLLTALLEDYRETQVSNWPEDRAAWATRDAIADTVRHVIENRTRPIASEDLLPGEGPWSLPKFAVTPALRAELNVIEVPGEKGTLRRAFNTDRFQELQESATTRANKGRTAVGDDDEPNAASTKKANPSPAEVRRKEADADRELRERVQRPGGLAEQGLRYAMAVEIADTLRQKSGGTQATNLVGQVLLDAAIDSAGSAYLQTCPWRNLGWRLVWRERAEAAGKEANAPKMPPFMDHKAYGQYTAATLDGTENYVTDTQRHLAHVARLILFPSASEIIDKSRLAKWGDWPVRWPVIDQVILVRLATALGVSLAKAWEAGRKPGPARRWVELVIATHNTRRQREALAKELGVLVCSEDSLAEMGKKIVAVHADHGVAVPTVLRR